MFIIKVVGYRDCEVVAGMLMDHMKIAFFDPKYCPFGDL
jgi:hypothetical protein